MKYAILKLNYRERRLLLITKCMASTQAEMVVRLEVKRKVRGEKPGEE